MVGYVLHTVLMTFTLVNQFVIEVQENFIVFFSAWYAVALEKKGFKDLGSRELLLICFLDILTTYHLHITLIESFLALAAILSRLCACRHFVSRLGH